MKLAVRVSAIVLVVVCLSLAVSCTDRANREAVFGAAADRKRTVDPVPFTAVIPLPVLKQGYTVHSSCTIRISDGERKAFNSKGYLKGRLLVGRESTNDLRRISFSYEMDGWRPSIGSKWSYGAIPVNPGSNTISGTVDSSNSVAWDATGLSCLDDIAILLASPAHSLEFLRPVALDIGRILGTEWTGFLTWNPVAVKSTKAGDLAHIQVDVLTVKTNRLEMMRGRGRILVDLSNGSLLCGDIELDHYCRTEFRTPALVHPFWTSIKRTTSISSAGSGR
jgi:hypothetical protein